MKYKENIFEELNKMRNLINAKAGTVISEQGETKKTVLIERDAITNDGSELQTIRGVLSNLGLNPTEIAKEPTVGKKGIQVKTDQGTFDFVHYKPGGYWNQNNFVIQNKNGVKTLGTWDYDKLFMKASGVMDFADRDFNNIISISTLKPESTPAAAPAAGTRTPEAMKTITSTFCGVRNGIIMAGVFKDQPWTNYKTKYNVTDAEEQEAKKSCPTVNTGSPSRPRSGQSGPSVGTRFANSAKSLGVEGGKMDLQTLQTILKNLESDTSTIAAAPTQGTPDLAQLTAALNQLQA